MGEEDNDEEGKTGRHGRINKKGSRMSVFSCSM